MLEPEEVLEKQERESHRLSRCATTELCFRSRIKLPSHTKSVGSLLHVAAVAGHIRREVTQRSYSWSLLSGSGNQKLQRTVSFGWCLLGAAHRTAKSTFVPEATFSRNHLMEARAGG
jgi:hypothetical protein